MSVYYKTPDGSTFSSKELAMQHQEYVAAFAAFVSLKNQGKYDEALIYGAKAESAAGNDNAKRVGLSAHLGEVYFRQKDYKVAISYFEDALDRNESSMNYSSLGLSNETITAVNKMLKEAKQIAAEKEKAARIEAERAEIRAKNADEENKLADDIRLGENGGIDVWLRLGKAYYWGNGVTKDYALSFKWYNKAAEKGNATAQFCLGRAYENGHGVSASKSKANHWYCKAAEQGDKDAQKWVWRNDEGFYKKLVKKGIIKE